MSSHSTNRICFSSLSFSQGKMTGINTMSLIELNHVCMSYRYSKKYTTWQ